MQLTLPDTLRPWAERKAACQGFTSVSDYVSDLLARERARDEPDLLIRDAIAEDRGLAPQEVASELVARRRREIDDKLLEAVASGPATPMTNDDWDALRRRATNPPSANG